MTGTEQLTCPDCQAPMQLKNSRYGKFFGCTRWPSCNGTHGAHPDGSPLGVPADSETKQARIRAHAVFDRLWKQGGMSRRAAYRKLREVMDLSPADAHIGRFTIAQCEVLIARLGGECTQ